MSTNLFWQPVFYDEKVLGNKLKFALRKRFGSVVSIRLDTSSISYLEGLVDAGVKDAQKLIDAIDKHGEIKLWEE